MKVIIAGGGTGGHLFPAVALGEELRRERPATQVLHVGTTNGFEAQWFPSSGLHYELFPVRGLRGKGVVTRMRAIAEFGAALRRGHNLLRRFSPDLVVSAGGYASAPMAVAALIGRVPLVLMEQNTRPGLSNRLLWRFARRICTGFADTRTGLRGNRVAVTGNPLRLGFVPCELREIRSPTQILVLGGSTGAHRLNLGVIAAFKTLAKDVIKFEVVHQSGQADVELLRREYAPLGVMARVIPFIVDMAAALDRAGLIIARGGAMTVSEIAIAGRAAIFVPYPFHRDHQQEHNARVIERLGGAIIVDDDDRLAEKLTAILRELLSNPSRVIEMGRKARQAGRPDAAAQIARICFEVIEGDQAA
ncbi:MAG TPA: undecaprenyldiphospho-muramoylpentapeptide beta-N-acetylglucosaminyltransferase [Candidatus Binataceae bacterium]|nr:undecaprenyldiphospho-muramoylpentapeptide beta-N-acetylglucosaminyltransferase [Candidatus Binataceae bacterium]